MRLVVLARDGHCISRKNIDPDALRILYRLRRLGFTAYLCGGAVRDLMLGRVPKDFDIVTDARPGQIKKRFANVFIIGRRFRLAHIHFQDGKIIEVATFRRDLKSGDKSDAGTCPEAAIDPAQLYGTPQEDAFRRDITINALYYDPVTFSVIDYVGGLEDLARRQVRIIGNPEERYSEDPVRIWRVLRHAARLGFELEESAERAIHTHGPLLATTPGARLYEELNKELVYETRPAIEALRRYRLLRYILGKAGEDYETDYGLFTKLTCLLDIEKQARETACLLSLEETYALLFWPWVEHLFDDGGADMSTALGEAFAGAKMQATLPKVLRTNVIQVLVVLEQMLRALVSGRMLWSLRKRAHYPQASRLCFLINRERAPQEGESFESLYKKAFPSAPLSRRRRRRRPR